VWEGPQWKGFLMAIAKAAPHSYDVLLQMPAHALDRALDNLPPEHWPKLGAHAASRGVKVPIFQPVRDVVAKYVDRAKDELRAKLVAAEAAQKERQEREKAAAAAAAAAAAGGEGAGGEGEGGAGGGEEQQEDGGQGGGEGGEEDWALEDD